ncbi:MAG: hypothetical protein ABFD50_03430 [Smithella sp.]|jgi:hypothetical protein
MDLWQQLTSFSNFYSGFRHRAKARRSRVSVAGFEFNLEENLIQLQQELLSGDCWPGDYTSFLHIY